MYLKGGLWKSSFHSKRGSMNAEEFAYIRKRLKKTQKEMAELLGTSVKTIHSYEQGWRKIPHYVERHLLFLFSLLEKLVLKERPCWEAKHCPEEMRIRCPAWQLKDGNLCWFINGTYCSGTFQGSWERKMKVCRECNVFMSCVSKISMRKEVREETNLEP
jgi:DNA-binding XRE family transcriptional regulator